MSGNKSSNPFRPRTHRYALEPRQMYDGAAVVEANRHVDAAQTAQDAGKFQSPATEQPGQAAPTPRVEARAFVAAASTDSTVTTASKGLTVAEPSSLNAPGADRGTLSGWTIAGASGDPVTVTARVGDATKGSLLSSGGGTTSDQGASYTFSGTRAQATAWLNQLTFVAADTELGLTAAKTTIDVTVNDGQAHTHSLDVTITPSNDPVSVADATLTVPEVDASGGRSITVIGTDTLAAHDPEVDVSGTQTPEQIVYSVTGLPQYGYLTLDGNRLGAGSIFTQQDVIDGRVAYVHTATGADQDTADGFDARVNDGATPLDRSDTVHVTLNITPVNQAPTIGGEGTVYEGQPANAHDTGNVGQYIVADTGGDPQDSALTVTITSLTTHGTLYFNGVAVTVGQTFDYSQRNLLTYGNDGAENIAQDSFGVSVSDEGGGTGTKGTGTGTIVLDIAAVDDDPVFDRGSTRTATVTAGGEAPAGAYAVTLTTQMIGASDVDTPDRNISFITSQAGLTHGYLTLNGQQLKDGATFTMDDVRNGRVQYVQVSGAAAGDQDTFHFQVVDNTTALRWNADGSTFTRIGGDYTGGTPTDTLNDFVFTIDLAPTSAGNGGHPAAHDPQIAESASDHAGTDQQGSTLGQLDEGGNLVIQGTTTDGQPTDVAHAPFLSYTATGVDPSQVVYTFLGFTNDAGITTVAGTLQKHVDNAWVNVAEFGTFTQADLDAGNIRFQHNGDSENFHVKANFSVSAGLITTQNGQPTVDTWTPAFDIYIRPTNDLPTVTGSSNTVIAEGETAYITRGQLGLGDPDDATSQSWLEGTPTLHNGDPNFADNNDATGANALKFLITSLPPGGKLQFSTDGGQSWQDVTVNTQLDASIITDSAGTTGLRFVSNGSEVRSASFTVEAQDRWGDRSASPATVTIQITNVNDAPQIAKDPTQADPVVPSDSVNQIGGQPVNVPLTLPEGGYAQITTAMLQAYDPDSTSTQVQYVITSAPQHGSVAFSTDGANFHILGKGSSFTQADVAAGHIYYLNDGTEPASAGYPSTPDDTFGFTLSDGDKEQTGNAFWIYTTPTNDAPVVKAPTGPVDIDSTDPANNKVPGFSVSDPDITDGIGAGETDAMQVTIRLLHADGTAFAAGEYTTDGVAIGIAGGSGVTIDADKDGSGDYLVLTGTRAQINAALAGLSVTFGSDLDATYQVQVIADDRLRDSSGALAGGANGGPVNQADEPGTGNGASTSPVDTNDYDWYADDVPSDSGNLAAAAVDIRASSVNEPATIGGPTATVPVYEDQPTHIGGGFTVSDPESAAFDTPVTVTLSVPSGTLGIGGTGVQTSASGAGGQAVTIAGDGTGTLVLTGRASDIEALLNDTTNGLTYLSARNVNHDTNGGDAGDVTLTMSLDDTGSRIGGDVGSGSVANNPADVHVALDIVPVNDAPTVNAGGDTVYLNGSTPVGGFSVDDVDYTDGGGIAAGEQDFMQVTVRVTDAAGHALAASNYANIVLGSSTAGTSGATVDGTFDGTDSALVIRGTRQQINDYLAGLEVSISGALANVDQAFRVEVVADDRLRDLASGALDGSNAANGGKNDGGTGTQNVPTTEIDPYADVPNGLGQNVSKGSRDVFPTSINNPTAIGVTGDNAADENAGDIYTLSHVTLADPDAGTTAISATITLQDGFSIHDVAGHTASGTYGNISFTISGDGRSVTITGAITDVQAAINSVGIRLPAAVAGDNNAHWNGTFQVQLTVNDNGNHGDRPDQGTLDADQAQNEQNDTTTVGDEYGYADGSSSALVTTRVIDVTVSAGTQVQEAGLHDGSGHQGVDGTETFALFNDLSSVTIGDPADGAGHFVTLPLAQLQDIANVAIADRTIATAHGTLVVTGYDSATRTLTYHYELTSAVNQPGATSSNEVIAISTTDSKNVTDNGTLTVNIVDDVPVAVADQNDVNENGTPTTGNVIGNGSVNDKADTIGADANATPVTGVAAGNSNGVAVSGRVGTVVTGVYGRLTLNADGSYSYTVNDNDARVNALKDGRTLTDVYTYTITDGDGDRATATLTITIHGHTDGSPTVTSVDGNGAVAGQATVHESGLVDHDGTNAATGTITLTAPDGLASVTVGNTTLSLSNLTGLSPSTPRTILTPNGTLTLTGFTPTATVGGVPTAGTLSYTFTLTSPIAQQPSVTDSTLDVALLVTDAGNGTAAGTLTIDVVNDVPTANADHADINENGTTVAGNVVAGGGTNVADRVGADATATPVSGVAAGNSQGANVTGNVGIGVTGTYGTLTLNADGSYTYAIDTDNAELNALKNSETRTDTYTYTITDADGDTSTTTLTITIHGQTDGTPSVTPHDDNGAAAGHETVHESGLVDQDGSQVVSGNIDFSAGDGLQSITVGGTTLSLAQLDALAAGGKVVIDTDHGKLELNGYEVKTSVGGVPTSGTLSYTYTLTQVTAGNGTTDDIPLVVSDAHGGTQGPLTINIVNDTPAAHADNADVNEDGPSITGNVVSGAGPRDVADRIGADTNASPVSGVAAGDSQGANVNGHVGTGVTGTYGTLTLNADGSYGYVLDNTNATVNALKDGDTLTDTYTYTITDGDGDTSTTTLTITIHGHTDGAPTAEPHDGNGAGNGTDAVGDATVWESGLTSDGPVGQASHVSDTIDITAPDGLLGIEINGVAITRAELEDLAQAPKTIVTSKGTLTLTGFDETDFVGGVPTRGTLSYTYDLAGPLVQVAPDHANSTDTFAVTVHDVSNGTGTRNLVIDIVNDAPTANADRADVNEDGGVPVTGNVVTGGGTNVADRLGADGTATPVTGVAAGDVGSDVTGSVGSGIAGHYGTLTLNADGSYSYAVDDANATVNGLRNGQTLTDTYTYTITDADGDTSTTTLTITLHGHTDGVPTIVPVDGNGGVDGHATVAEAGLVDHDGSQATTGTIDLTADDGLAGIVVGGTPVSLAELANLSTTPITIHTPDGTLVLTGFQPGSTVGGVPTSGTLSYTYTLDHETSTPNAANGHDDVALKVIDAGGGEATGTLRVNIVDDVPTANHDDNAIDENTASVGGSVIANDRIGADGTASPVTGVAAGVAGGDVGGHVGTGVDGTYGTLTLNADGSYSYALDNANPTVNALKDGETLTDTYTYTITDADGDTSTTTLTITIKGHTDGNPAIAPAGGANGAGGHASVAESGLVDHDGSQTTTGVIDVTADDGLSSVTVGGTTLTADQLAALSGGTPVTVHTPDGTLVLTGFQPTSTMGGVPTAGTISYTYTLDHPTNGHGVTDTIALTVTDRGGDTTAGALVVDIANDVPTAHDDSATIVQDAGQTATSGNVFTGTATHVGADRIGADGSANGGPVTGVVSGNTGHAGSIGGISQGAFGTLVLNADGTYSYTLDTANPTVSALDASRTLTETFVYTITDADGDTSTATLTITIHGTTPPMQARWGDQIFPIVYQRPDRDIRQGWEPGLFVVPEVNQSQDDTVRWQNQWVTGRGGFAVDAGLPRDPSNVQFVLDDGVAFSRKVLAEAHARSRVALNDFGLASSPLWDDFSPFAPTRVGQLDAYAHDRGHADEHEREHLRPHATAHDALPAPGKPVPATTVPPPASTPSGAPSLTAQIAAMATSGAVPLAQAPAAHPSRH
ncbi:VCBS domain-containing protein [Luteibacter sp. CQ10]|uniref:VCBS domain-containing protein n=1 Tax=Luteibacter sp. CQ10 TaxID=2805821 RepID=UPI0034A2ADAD